MFFLAVFDRILFIFAGNQEDIHKSLNEFKFRPDPTTEYGVVTLERLKNQCPHFSVDIDPILF